MIAWTEIKKAVHQYEVEKSRAKRLGFSIEDFLNYCKIKYGQRTKT